MVYPPIRFDWALHIVSKTFGGKLQTLLNISICRLIKVPFCSLGWISRAALGCVVLISCSSAHTTVFAYLFPCGLPSRALLSEFKQLPSYWCLGWALHKLAHILFLRQMEYIWDLPCQLCKTVSIYTQACVSLWHS